MTMLPTSFDPLLVACSLIVAWLASYATLTLVGQAHAGSARTPAWTVGGAILLGFGIWAMHFIGMIAFRLPVTVAYHAPTMTLSWVAAVLASGFALSIASRPKPTPASFASGAIIMGGAINSMHYIGMAAMHVNATVQYNAALVGLSVLIAVSASWGALRLGLSRSQSDDALLRVIGGFLLGIAIAGMHYVAMLAASFHAHADGIDAIVRGDVLSSRAVGWGAALVATAVLAAGIWAVTINERAAVIAARALKTRERNEELEAYAAQRSSEVRAQAEELRKRNEALQAETDALKAFAAYTETVGTHVDIEELAGAAIDVLRVALSDASLAYHQHDRGEAVTGKQVGMIDAAVTSAMQVTAASARMKQQPIIQDAAGDSPAHAVYPVIVQGELRGLLTAELTQPAWTDRDRLVFSAVGSGLSLAAERAFLIHRLQVRQEQLTRANEELEAFSYTVSHDLRAPARHILSFAQVLRRHLPDDAPPRALQSLEFIDRSAAQMHQLIDKLLDLARLARVDLQRESVNLDDLVRELSERFTLAEPQRRIEWRGQPLGEVWGDAALLRQVLENLLGNAVKYTRHREVARIDVWCTRAPGEVAVFVRDNGAGFDPRFAGKLFGAFQRLHRADEFEGTGVGLANVRRIVTRHGGRVWAEGAVDQGATFAFALPVRAVQDTRSSSAEANSDTG